MILKEVLDRTTVFLKNKQMESPRFEAEILVSHALSMERVELYLKFDKPLAEAELEKCRDVLKRRMNGESIAYIVGFKNFYKHKFKVGPGVLVPRPESEWMVEKALSWIKENQDSEAKYQILDLGAGTGCLGLSLAAELLNAQVTLVDESAEALQFAKINTHNLKLSERTKIIHARVEEIEISQGGYDIVLANPPYISFQDNEVDENVRKFEPKSALFAEDNGLQALKEWIPIAASATKQPGICIFEIGAKQGTLAMTLFEQTKAFNQIKLSQDFAGLDRNITATKDKR